MQPDYQTPERMAAKLRAIPLPELQGKSVLDVGCDMRAWEDVVREKGAAKYVGVDRGRHAGANGFISLGDVKMELGTQYHDIGKFDVVLMLSLYHHCYAAAGGDHNAIWYWLSRQVKPGGVLLWENPVDTRDAVVRMNVPPGYWDSYNREAILSASLRYFTHEYVGPAIHEPTREVYRFTRKPMEGATIFGWIQKGGGGATGAFEYAERRRCKEFDVILGWTPHAGSMNVRAAIPFPWDENYFRAQVLDVADRTKGLDSSSWVKKWARFYPLEVAGSLSRAVAFRFEGEEYAPNFVELVAESNLGSPTSVLYADYGKSGWVYDNMMPAVQVEMRLVR